MDFSSVEVLSFDCYGTLVDWETGILAALRPLLESHGASWDDGRILREYAEAEAALEAGPYLPYRQVLSGVAQRVAARAGFEATAAERASLAASVPRWQPFPDTVEALAALARRFRLVIISNIEDELFAQTALCLRTPFDAIITAEQARSYKPALSNFRLALQRVGVPPRAWVHVGASPFHDVGPASELGLGTVFVNRRHDRPDGGASPRTGAVPGLEVPDLAALARLLSMSP